MSILLSGGPDPIATVDPRTKAETFIDVDYRPEEVLHGAARSYGPMFAPLMPFEKDLALVLGLRLETTAHSTGFSYHARGQRTNSPRAGFVGDIVGRILPGTAPCRHVAFESDDTYFSPLNERAVRSEATRVSRSLAAQFYRSEPIGVIAPWMDQVSSMAAESAAPLFSRDADRELYVRHNHEAEALFRMLAAPVAPLSGIQDDPVLGHQLHFAFELIRRNLARYITLAAPAGYLDSHRTNREWMEKWLMPVVEQVSAFLHALDATRSDGVPLSERTTVLIGGEIGRFPKINVAGGRDHWPESFVIAYGAGIRRKPNGLTIGGTDDYLRSQPIDFETGAVSRDGHELHLGCVASGLIKSLGREPSDLGFPDRPLRCLFDS